MRKTVSLDPFGDESGTVYLGAKQAKVKARVYDKRLERLEKHLADPGPWTRYELVGSSDLGISLRDAGDPAPFFWHYMGHTVLERPSDVPAWTPGAIGFNLPARPSLDPSEVFERRLAFSREFRDLTQQALSVQGGLWILYRYFRDMGVQFTPEHMLDGAPTSPVVPINPAMGLRN